MAVYIVIYIVIGVIAGIIDDGSEKKKNLSFTLMIIGAIISFLTNGIFVIAAIIEMAIGYLLIIRIKSFLKNKSKINSKIKCISEANTALEKKKKERLVNWAIQFNISKIVNDQEYLGNITKLDIHNKRLTYLPSGIDCLKNLRSLNCYNTNLTSLPISFNSLHNLTELNLYNNKLTSLPSNIGSMKNLSILSLSKNDLRSLPESIINLKSLKKLQLIENESLKISENQRLWILNLIFNKIDVEIDNQLLIKKNDKDINVRNILKKAMDDVESNQSILVKNEAESIIKKEIKEEQPKTNQYSIVVKKGLTIVKKANSEENHNKDIIKSVDKEFEKAEIEEWIQKLWDWADEHHIPNGKLSRKKENLVNTKIIDLTNIKLSYLPKEIINLENLQELILWSCELKYLPRDITKLDKLIKLNLRGNPELAASLSQLSWIDHLNKNGIVLKDSIRTIREETVDMYDEPFVVEESDNIQLKEPQKVKLTPLIKVDSNYTKALKNIENSNFEKIRRYCNNLLNDNKADEMQKYLAENGKMYKALIYDALEQFISKLNKQTITLVDWGCNQGIDSMLVLDYIKEKQLDIHVKKIFLLNGSKIEIQRALENLNALKLKETEIYATNNITNEFFVEYELDYNDIKTIEQFNHSINDNLLHLFINRSFNVSFYEDDWYDYDFKIYHGYFLCVSQNQDIIEELNSDLIHFKNVFNKRLQDISLRDNKIGRFQRYERIFKIDK